MTSDNLGEILELDKIIHERARLGIMTALSVTEKLTFQELKTTLNITDGNLSVHLRLLEKHEYIDVTKSFVGRKPCSTYSLTKGGRKTFEEYIQKLEKLIQLPQKRTKTKEHNDND